MVRLMVLISEQFCSFTFVVMQHLLPCPYSPRVKLISSREEDVAPKLIAWASLSKSYCELERGFVKMKHIDT